MTTGSLDNHQQHSTVLLMILSIDCHWHVQLKGQAHQTSPLFGLEGGITEMKKFSIHSKEYKLVYFVVKMVASLIHP